MMKLFNYFLASVNDIWTNFLLRLKANARKKALKRAKNLADDKSIINGRRYYVLYDERDGGYLVLNRREMVFINKRYKTDLNFLAAMYKTK